MKIDTILKSKPGIVFTCQSTDDIVTACRILRENTIKAVPVLEDGKVVGIFTSSDVIGVIAEMGEVNALVMPVSEYMTRTVTTLGLNSTVDEANKLMENGGFTHLPVLDEEGTLIGIISLSDVTRAYIQLLSEANSRERMRGDELQRIVENH